MYSPLDLLLTINCATDLLKDPYQINSKGLLEIVHLQAKEDNLSIRDKMARVHSAF